MQAILPRMRSIKETAAYFKEADPNTQVGEYFIRKLVLENKIPMVRTGKKVLINLDAFIEYLNYFVNNRRQDRGKSRLHF